MRHWRWGFWLPIMFIALGGCSPSPDPGKRSDSAPPAVSAEIQDAALLHGKAIAQEAFGLLSTNLQTAIRQGGVSNALPFCSVAALPLTESIAKRHGVTVRRVSHRARNPKGQADPAEAAILQQFTAALAGTNSPPLPIVTNLGPSTVTFFAPIILNNELCLNCHGEPGREIRPENLAVIRNLYPKDQATGFRLGELRGAWRIDFPIGALVSPQ